ncbi:hypothetical protein [Pseudomonas sp. HR96]|uniref:hypothetical protein n=1 Tax=Pseudomonas sp. HR96 TaxID=1027966 RepID=UPI0039BE74BD
MFHVQRARQAALSVARHLIWREHLGIAQSNAHVFDLLGGAGWCELELLDSVKGLVELSDTAVRKPRVLQISMLISAITHEAGKLQAFACAVLRRERSG